MLLYINFHDRGYFVNSHNDQSDLGLRHAPHPGDGDISMMRLDALIGLGDSVPEAVDRGSLALALGLGCVCLESKWWVAIASLSSVRGNSCTEDKLPVLNVWHSAFAVSPVYPDSRIQLETT